MTDVLLDTGDTMMKRLVCSYVWIVYSQSGKLTNTSNAILKWEMMVISPKNKVLWRTRPRKSGLIVLPLPGWKYRRGRLWVQVWPLPEQSISLDLEHRSVAGKAFEIGGQHLQRHGEMEVYSKLLFPCDSTIPHEWSWERGKGDSDK